MTDPADLIREVREDLEACRWSVDRGIELNVVIPKLAEAESLLRGKEGESPARNRMEPADSVPLEHGQSETRGLPVAGAASDAPPSALETCEEWERMYSRLRAACEEVERDLANVWDLRWLADKLKKAREGTA